MQDRLLPNLSVMSSNPEEADYVRLYALGLIPRYVVLASIVWVLHDYFVTLEDEVRYIWTQKACLSRFMYFWIRYYTIFLVIFDVVQIHYFAQPGVANEGLCVAADPITRVTGAISLWSVEVIMILRIYVLYRRSKNILLINGGVFITSIGLFVWVLVNNVRKRGVLISQFVQGPISGCPPINGGSQWAQWVPATVVELFLFGFALTKAAVSTSAKTKLNGRPSLTAILLQENILYFLSVACLLIFNNLMVVGATRIPWFGFGPFHGALGIATSRMMIHLRKFEAKSLKGEPDIPSLPDMRNIGSPSVISFPHLADARISYDESTELHLSHDLESIAGTSQIGHDT